MELKFGGRIYKLYQHSYDGYGLMRGRERIVSHHLQLGQSESSACLSPTKKLALSQGHVTGNNDGLAECLKLIESAMFSKTTVCSINPCSFDGVYMPKLSDSFAHDLYAFSYFYDKYAEPFDKNSFLVKELKDAAHQVCSSHEPQLTTLGVKEFTKNQEWCTDLSFMYSLLANGYSIPHDREILSAKKIDGIEIGWSVGAAIQMLDNQISDSRFQQCNS